MSNISHGMNVGDIRRMGSDLQNKHAEQIRQLMTEIEGMVSDTAATWVGPDAEQFRSWWPEKKASLSTIAEDLYGFGQSAINNADAQETVSGA